MTKIVVVKKYLFLLLVMLPTLIWSEVPRKDPAGTDDSEMGGGNPAAKVEKLYQNALELRSTDLKLAIKNAEDGGDLAGKSGLYKLAFDCYFLAGEMYGDRNTILPSKLAIGAFEQCAVYAKKGGDKPALMMSYKRLAQEYAAIKQSQSALDYYKKYTDLEEDKIQLKAEKLSQTLEATQKNVAKQEEQISSLETQKSEVNARLDAVSREVLEAEVKMSNQLYENEMIKRELSEERNKRNMLMGGILGVVLVLTFLTFAFIQSRRSKNKLAAQNALIQLERSKSDSLLLNILPKPVATELKENGKTVPRSYDDVTVLFTDFKSFTKVSEKLSPIDLVHEIDYCFRAFDEIIAKYNIEKIKTIGDAYMCVSGLPEPHKNHCHEILYAAIEIRDFMNNLFLERKASGKTGFTMRMGIHSGPLVAGVVGSTKFVYDVWGDTVNIAARMEQNCEEGRINVSAKVADLAKDSFKFEYRGKLDAKNKGELDMYFVEDAIETPAISPLYVTKISTSEHEVSQLL